MQRWIVAAVVATLLAGIGGFYTIKVLKQNRPAPMWVQLPVNPEVPVEKREEIIAKLRADLTRSERLVKVSRDLRLAGEWKLSSEEDAAEEVASRLFVREGLADSPEGSITVLQVGVKGKRKEIDLSGRIAKRLMEDVYEILGIEPPQR